MATLSVYNEGAYGDGIYNLFSAPGDVALKVNGKGQYLARIEDPSPDSFGVYNEGVYNDEIYNFPAVNLGISNLWTLGFWVKPRPYKEHATIFSTAGRDGKNEIRVTITPVPEERVGLAKNFSEMRVLIKDDNGTTIKHYSWPNWFQTEEWVHTTVEWDGTDLEAFKGGTLTTTGVIFADAAGTMLDCARKIFYGANVDGDGATFSGTLGHLGMWDSLVSPVELGTVVSGGFSADLTVGSGTYTSSGTLQHYYRPGDDPTNIGKDYTVSGTALDLEKDSDVRCEINIIVDEPA